MRYINEVDLRQKRVLIRVDFNVPLDENQNITDDNRIRAALPTINYALDEGAKVIVASHIGRPKGKRVAALSMAPVARRLGRLLQKDVKLAPDCVGAEVRQMVEALQPGEVLVLENLRFHPGETLNEDDFAKELASLCDIYVNDAFAVAHRENASVVAVARFAPIAVAGFTMKKELEYFKRSLL
ncbi:MAG: phosphoglycerate kinase, partial [Desulfarculus sp.]|nr:phosphoglycerate kinase [Desulfarculus sp.]